MVRIHAPEPSVIERSAGSRLLVLLSDLFHVIEELDEHDPGKHGQAVQVTVKALVFPHDILDGFDQAAEFLGSSDRLGGLLFTSHSLLFR